MDKIDVSVLKYLGKVGEGIIALVTINFIQDEFLFDATFYYTDSQMILTVPLEVEEEIGNIKLHPSYQEILQMCLKKVVPFNQMIDKIDPLDVKPYLKAIFPNENFE
jgi:hypothetical protein